MPKFSFSLNDFSKDYLPFEFNKGNVAVICFLRIAVKNNKAFFLYAQLPDCYGVSVTNAEDEIFHSSIECIQNEVNFCGQPILEKKVAFNLLEKVIVSIQKRRWENEEKCALYTFLLQNAVWVEHYPRFVRTLTPGSFRITFGSDYDEWIDDFNSEKDISSAFPEFFKAENETEEVVESSDISSNNEHIERQVRNFARQIWQEHPNMGVEEMLVRNEIKHACEGKYYDKNTLELWILPNIEAPDELARLKTLPAWKLIEAVAVWLYLNPFLMEKIAQNKIIGGFWDMQYAAHPNMRANFGNLFEVSKASIAAGTLKAVHVDGQYFVNPRDFYAWAINNTEGPAEGAKKFFSEFRQAWDAEIDVSERNEEETSKPLSRVDKKREEILRILELISKTNPEFDKSAMPGRKEDFHALCKEINKGIFSVAQSTFNDYLTGLCTFQSGARETNFYKKISKK